MSKHKKIKMDHKLIEMLKDFKPIVIKAKVAYSADLPGPIKFVYGRMTVVGDDRLFGFRAQRAEHSKRLCFYADPEYGRYSFAALGEFELNEDTGRAIVERLLETWYLKPGDFDKYFEFIVSKS